MVSLLASLELFVARSFLKQRRVPNENFRISDAEKVRQKNLISPSLIHAIFSLPECLWNTEVFPMHFVGKRRQKFFDGICIIPRLVHIFLPILEIFWKHFFCSLWVFSIRRDKKNVSRKTDFPNPFMKSFRWKKVLLKQWKVRIEIFRYCETKKLLLQKRNIHLASKNCFRCQKFSERTESSQNVSVKWDTKISTEKLDIPLASIIHRHCQSLP